MTIHYSIMLIAFLSLSLSLSLFSDGVFQVEVGVCDGEKSGLRSAAVRLHEERRNLN